MTKFDGLLLPDQPPTTNPKSRINYVSSRFANFLEYVFDIVCICRKL